MPSQDAGRPLIAAVHSSRRALGQVSPVESSTSRISATAWSVSGWSVSCPCADILGVAARSQAAWGQSTILFAVNGPFRLFAARHWGVSRRPVTPTWLGRVGNVRWYAWQTILQNLEWSMNPTLFGRACFAGDGHQPQM